ncbi:MAG: 4'-phosphopantetheinyl transferase superfamily protein [Leptolyngbyaceae cyanobacterium MO_188.B28]|nr:4'-phosphopantetheinyl transferase superfamily protein [Leptolyngbyaceae cyanobacterium MO_188.B28]
MLLEPDDCNWGSPASSLSLSVQDVHLWQANVALPKDLIQQLGEILSTDEWQRAQRFHFERDRGRFIAGRGILRTILSRYLAIAPSQIEFCYGPQGKPALSNSCGDSSLCFNLSHSGDRALYAITRDRQIGVDIEQLREINAEQLAQRFFSPQESAVINSLSPQQKKTGFFQLWTCKEAVLKAIGKGIAGLEQVELRLGIEEPTRLIRLDGESLSIDKWSIQQFSPAPEYTACLAAEGNDLDISFLRFPVNYLRLLINFKEGDGKSS